MLLFQHAETPTLLQHDQFKKLIIASCIGHGALLMCAFLMNNQDSLTICLQPEFFDETMVVVPLSKTVPLSVQKSGGTQRKANSKEGQNVTTKVKKTFASVTAFVPQKKETAPTIAPTPTFSAFKPKKKQILPESAPLEKIKAAEEPTPPQQSDELLSESPIAIGYVQAHEIQVIKDIKAAILAYWQPPCGFTLSQPCHVAIEISVDGLHKSVEVQQSSGIPAYDCAARLAAKQATFPKEKWGKKIVVIFNS